MVRITQVRIRNCFVALSVATAIVVVLIHRKLEQKGISHLIQNYSATKCKTDSLFNVAVWDNGVDSRTFENVLGYPKFPRYPDRSYMTDSWRSVVAPIQTPCIKRIVSYLRPTENGFYQFRVNFSPIRVFLETSRGEAHVILKSNSTQNGEIYSEVYLLHDSYSYYFEVQLFSLPERKGLVIEWLAPGATAFKEISSRNFTCRGFVVAPRYPVLPVLPPDVHYLLSFIPRIHLSESFSECTAVNQTTPAKFDAETIVYTPPGNPPAGVQEAVQAVMSGLEKAIPKKYPSFDITKFESTQTTTARHCRRLLIDLEFIVDGLDYKQRMSEYFLGYYHGNNFTLCKPVHYYWNPLEPLNFVFIADCRESQGVWVDYFIKNMIELAQTSLDVQFKVTITTCNESLAKDYERRLRECGLHRYAVVLLDGTYLESRAFKAALSTVEMSNSVVVLCRPRLYMPTAIFEEIRKHTFEHSMAYVPTPFQLTSGYFPGNQHVEGNWCVKCSSLVALYYKDWRTLFKTKLELDENGEQQANLLFQGGNLLQHISNSGIEIIQVKLNNFYKL